MIIVSSVSHVIFTLLFLSLSSLLAKTESNNVDSGREMMESVKVGHNGGILACDIRYKTKCQNNPWRENLAKVQFALNKDSEK